MFQIHKISKNYTSSSPIASFQTAKLASAFYTKLSYLYPGEFTFVPLHYTPYAQDFTGHFKAITPDTPKPIAEFASISFANLAVSTIHDFYGPEAKIIFTEG